MKAPRRNPETTSVEELEGVIARSLSQLRIEPSPDEPTGRASARPMTGAAIFGSLVSYSPDVASLIRATMSPRGDKLQDSREPGGAESLNVTE
jgi:hypothetical protein